MRLAPKAVAIVLAAYAGASCAQTIYKCGTTYSQTPCGAEQKQIHIRAADSCEIEANKYSPPCLTRPSSAESLYADNPQLRKLREDFIKARKARDELVVKHCAGKAITELKIGMSRSDSMCIEKYRSAATTNTTTTASGKTTQYVFRKHGRATYLYFTNEVLTAVQGEE